jgi:outer membrane protein
MKFRIIALLVCASLCLSGPLTSPALAQSFVAGGSNEVRIDPAHGKLGWLTRPYQQRYVPPISLANSSRLQSLIRAGNLYLTAQDVVALAIENNIDVEVQRYNPLLQSEVLRRAQGGGALRSVGQSVAAGPTSVSLTGVSLNGGGTAGTSVSGVSSGGGITTQLGPSIPNLDPSISFFASYSHATSPQSNIQFSGVTDLIFVQHQYQGQYSQTWATGTSALVTYFSNYNKTNSPFYTLNPFTSADIDLQITQNLLYGFGTAVNARNIRVQKNNMKVTDLQFKQQVITTVAAVLNLYWDLVSFYQDLTARQEEVSTAQQLLEDNKKQVDLGSLAEIEVTRAESQLYSAKQDLVISQTNLAQQETVLKNALSRTGVSTSDLLDIHVVPLDKIVIPARDETRPTEELVQQAIGNRLEIQEGRLNIDSNRLNLVGVKNSLKPSLQAFAELTNNGLTGVLSPSALLAGGINSSYLLGGYGNVLGEIARRNFPNYSAGFALNIPIRNRAAQADYVTSLLEIRQNELSLQKTINQVRVDVQNAVIGLEQARARYDASVKARELSQQTFDADQKKYGLGATTAFQVVQDQRDLATAQSSEAQAMANYSHARISFEEALGTTLEDNHITVTEAMSGKVTSIPLHPVQAGPAQ